MIPQLSPRNSIHAFLLPNTKSFLCSSYPRFSNRGGTNNNFSKCRLGLAFFTTLDADISSILILHGGSPPLRRVHPSAILRRWELVRRRKTRMLSIPSSELILTNSSEPMNPEEALHPQSLPESKSSSEPKTGCPKSDSTLRLDRSEKDTAVPNQEKVVIVQKGYKAHFCKPPGQRRLKSKSKLDQISALTNTEAASKDQEITSISRQNSVIILWDVDNKRISPSYDDVVNSLKNFAGHFGELINISAFGSHLAFSKFGTKLIEAGVHIECVGTAPQEADEALQRAWEKWKMTQLEKKPSSFIWLILVSDDAGFRFMLRSGKRSEFGVVIVNEFFNKLSLEGDLRVPWPQLKAGNYSLDGLADHIVGISTMGRRWMRENMNITDFGDEDPIDKVTLKLRIQLTAKNTMKRELLLRTMQKRSILEQRLKHIREKDFQNLEDLEKAFRKLEDPSRYKTMQDIHGSILKLETKLKARIETNKTESSTHEAMPLGDMSDQEFLENLSHTDFVEGLMRLAKNSSSPKIDSNS